MVKFATAAGLSVRVHASQSHYFPREIALDILKSCDTFQPIKLDDSAFFQTQSYITEICYFDYLQSLLFGSQKPFFSQVQINIKPN